MTSMPASRNARAMIFAPRSCPSSPGFAITTLIFRATVAESSLGPVELRGVVWLGTRTSRFDEMTAFAQDVLGLKAKHSEDGLAMYELPRGDLFEVFDESHPGGGHPDGVAGGFLVDDADAAVAELRAAGVEVTDVDGADGYRWAYFRAPDGNLYEVTSGPYGRT
jgi:catechol 2,3-dioxygenase-like lactoylglutathione lyase family enzyme